MKDKILAIAATPYFSDRGAHIRIYNELKYLAKADYDIELVTYGLGYTPENAGFTVTRCANLAWYQKVTPGASIWKPLLDLFLLVTSIRRYFGFKPAVLQPFQYESLAIAVIIRLITLGRARIIFDCQGSVTQELGAYNFKNKMLYKFVSPFVAFAEKVLLAFTEKIYCSSINSYNYLHDNFHIPQTKLALLVDGIDMDIFNGVNETEVKELRTKLRIPQENKVIIYTGSLNVAKGVDKLMDAIPQLVALQPNLTFVILGYGALQDIYEQKLGSLVDSHNVVFLGRTGYFDLPKYLKMSDYGIDTKTNSSESSGKLFNYLAANLPVICFDGAFNREILHNSGLYIHDFTDIPGLLNQLLPITKLEPQHYWDHVIANYAT